MPAGNSPRGLLSSPALVQGTAPGHKALTYSHQGRERAPAQAALDSPTGKQESSWPGGTAPSPGAAGTVCSGPGLRASRWQPLRSPSISGARISQKQSGKARGLLLG